ncbi:MAG: hypothetical protein AAF771_05160 [Pseudomonadota bacterium]
MDVLRSHTNQSGYDLLLEARGIQRHVQLKSSFLGARTSRQKINTRLAARPSGCIVWIPVDPTTLTGESSLWFGGIPGAPLPDLGERVAKHTKGNAEGVKTERAQIRIVKKGAFEFVNGFEALADRLFGGEHC